MFTNFVYICWLTNKFYWNTVLLIKHIWIMHLFLFSIFGCLTGCSLASGGWRIRYICIYCHFCINPILTGGGGVNLTPPCTKSATVSRPPLIATRFFMTFFFQVLRIFWYQVCENRTIAREVTRLLVLARRLKICTKIRILHMFMYNTHGNYWFS